MTTLYVPQKEATTCESSAIEKSSVCNARAALTPVLSAADLSPAPVPVPVLRNISLDLITLGPSLRYIATNGSTAAPDDAGHENMRLDLAGLARSMGDESAPRLAAPPIVEERDDGSYRIVTGQRRVQAARIAGWSVVPCLVYPAMDPVYTHTLLVLENVQRSPLHPLEEISALCISRLLANADARGLGAEARRILEASWAQALPGSSIAQSLDEMLRASGWDPGQPEVGWNAHLDDLGICPALLERKRKLRMLSIEPSVQGKLNGLVLTEAALRALGTLAPEEQQKVVESLIENPALARKIRRIARARRDGFYASIDDALAEVQGFAPGERAEEPGFDSFAEENEGSRHAHRARGEEGIKPSPTYTSDLASGNADENPTREGSSSTLSTEVQDAVLQLLECGDRLSEAMHNLQAYSGGTPLPEPWGSWSRDTLRFMLSSIEGALALPELPV